MITITVPNKISITTDKNLKLLKYFSLGEIINKPVFPEEITKYNVELNICPDPKEFLDEPSEKYSSDYWVNQNSVYYERKYAGLTCKLLVKSIDKNQFICYTNPTYLKIAIMKMDSLYPVGLHIHDILLTKILADNDLIIHGAGLKNIAKDDSFLIIAPPDTGKTYTTYQLLKSGNFKFLGEDLSYYSKAEDELLCVPFTSTWGHHFQHSWTDNFSRIPILGLFRDSNKKIVTDFFGSAAVEKKAKLSRIYLLEKSNTNSLIKIAYSEEMYKKVLIIQRNEFSYYKNPLIRAYEYYNIDKLDVDSLFQKEGINLKSLLQNKDLFLVKSQSHSEFHKLIEKNEAL